VEVIKIARKGQEGVDSHSSVQLLNLMISGHKFRKRRQGKARQEDES